MAILQNTTVSGSLVVTGDLTARQFILSSSVTFFTESFASGSTRFGDSMDDTMTVTGSLRLTGSATLNGNVSITDTTSFGGQAKLFSRITADATTVGKITDSGLHIWNTTTVGSLSQITLGYTNGSTTNASVYLGLITTNGAGSGYGDFVLGTAPSANVQCIERMRITAAGNVLIGTTSVVNASAKLEVKGDLFVTPTGSAASKLHFYNNDSTNETYIYDSGSASTSILTFAPGGVTKMIVNSSGNVGIGTNSPSSILTVLKTITTNYGAKGNGAISLGTAGSTGEANLINFGYDAGTWQPAYMGYLCTSGAGSSNGALIFATRDSTSDVQPTERMRITSGGYVGIGTTDPSGYSLAVKAPGAASDTGGVLLMLNGSSAISHYFFSATNTTMNTQDASTWIRRNATTSRSINASGTINASGADYAEYMLKAIDDNIEKGDIVGINSIGKLTNIFADSVSFVMKSTDPSYVGGDTWFNVEPPIEKDYDTKEEYDAAYEEFKTQRETARQKVDRISFSGQIPCNVTGANVGDYIIPIQLENGKISGQAVTNPTFEQYQISVGKVWKIMDDGRAWIAVKIG